MYSAQAKTNLTRRGGPGRSQPNIISSAVLAAWGMDLAPVPVEYLAGMLGAVIAAAVLLDQVKILLFQAAEAFATSSQAVSEVSRTCSSRIEREIPRGGVPRSIRRGRPGCHTRAQISARAAAVGLPYRGTTSR
jgi:hypothetical protein